MKTSTLLVSLFILLGSTTATYAGPGAQYWQQRRNPPASEEKPSAQKAKSTEPEAAPAKSETPAAKCEANKCCSTCGAKN